MLRSPDPDATLAAMNRAPGAPRIAMVCPGVGREQRGFERLFADLHGVMRRRMDITLFKGGGRSSRDEIVPTFVPRNSRIARILPVHALFGRTPIHTECLTFAMALLPHLQRGRYDIVHCIDPPLCRLLYKARSMLGLRFRLLYSEGTAMPPSDYPPADHVHQIAPGSFEAAKRWGIPVERMTMLPPGIDADRFRSPSTKSELRARHGISPGTFVILAVCAINRLQKRVDHLISEVARLEGDVLLWIDGSMDQGDPSLLDLAQDRLGDRCRITRVPTAQVGDLYRLADVKVLASVFEAFGLVVAEAMAAGVPVVTHDSPHFCWLCPNPRAHVDMREPGALADLLRELFTHRERLAELAPHPSAVERFDWMKLAPAYEEMYRSVAAGPMLQVPPRAAPAGRAVSSLPARPALSGGAARMAVLKCRVSNRAFRRSMPTEPMPEPRALSEVWGSPDLRAYWETGGIDARAAVSIMTEHLSAPHLALLDVSSGFARVGRHVPGYLGDRLAKLISLEPSSAAEEWCCGALTGIESHMLQPGGLNGMADGQFDAVCAFESLSRYGQTSQRALVVELHRMLKPGGMLICTTFGDRCRGLLRNREEWGRYNMNHSVEHARGPEGTPSFVIIQPPALVRERVLRDFESVGLISPDADRAGASMVDLWAARKRLR